MQHKCSVLRVGRPLPDHTSGQQFSVINSVTCQSAVNTGEVRYEFALQAILDNMFAAKPVLHEPCLLWYWFIVHLVSDFV